MILSALCPAKLNLFLRVGPPDARRYHSLRSVFQAVSLGDQITVRVADQNLVEFDDPAVPADNTVARALRLVAEIAPLPPLHVSVQKLVPAQSGLGAGSSDAAALLRIVSHLCPNLPKAELAGIARAVGADVPFFLLGGTALAEGYGERLTALPDPVRTWYVILRPDEGCPTPEMFRRLDSSRSEVSPLADAPFGTNDFEAVAPKACHEWIEFLRARTTTAGLTGSGSAVFGAFPTVANALAIYDEAQEAGAPFARVCRSLTRQESLAISVQV